MYKKFCIPKWMILRNDWVPTCMQPGQETNQSVVHCQCTQFSVISGYVQSAKYLRQEVPLEELELKLTTCKIIFMTTATTIGIISLLMLFTLIKKKRSNYIFLLITTPPIDLFT
ncbi:hypothetical protein Zmor_026164 [Zophobas morio]|uniref:GPS domain-containing protein n=1 Tax=Zophobas morio TaxID=2755281 RepID=A0AA38HYM9_9CUCU|nr:hypothetical protein Zmor_026164 [Zophobas morio]